MRGAFNFFCLPLGKMENASPQCPFTSNAYYKHFCGEKGSVLVLGLKAEGPNNKAFVDEESKRLNWTERSPTFPRSMWNI